MTTSGAVTAGKYATTIWAYPTSGAFATDRVAILGATSAASAQVGDNFEGILTPPRSSVSRTSRLLGDGSDHSRTRYRSKTVVVPVVIYESDPMVALAEWRRVVAAFDTEYQRVAVEVWDPNTTGQASRWLTRCVFEDADTVPLRDETHNWFNANLLLETDGQPFWTPEPITANEITGRIVPTTSGAIEQLFITNPGRGSWPRIEFNALPAFATVSIVLAGPLDRVDIVNLPANGTYTIDFDMRLRPLTDATVMAPTSEFFQIPPGDSRLDISATGAFGGNTWIDVSFLPRYATA